MLVFVNFAATCAEFDTLEDATGWVEQDPYVTSGVYSSYEVRPFMQVLP